MFLDFFCPVIFFNDSTGSITCTADRSCMNAIIYGDKYRDHELYGNLATMNATLYSPVNGTSVYYFYGAYSGYNTTIICDNHASCHIYCDGTGCNQLEMYCEGDGPGCNVTVDCDYAQKSDLCPDGMCCF